MFSAARRTKISESVVFQIETAILDGRLKTGDVLPSERDLRDMFQISRGTLREALRILEQKGLIDIRLGASGGAFVKSISTDQIRDDLALLIRFHKVSLDQLAEFREGVEGQIAALAAHKSTPEDHLALARLLDQAHAQWSRGLDGWQAFLQVDEQFHLAVARISRNPIYDMVQQSVHQNIHSYYEQFLPGDLSLLAENYQDLDQLTRAITAHDHQQAEMLARDHVRRFHRHMQPGDAVMSTQRAAG